MRKMILFGAAILALSIPSAISFGADAPSGVPVQSYKLQTLTPKNWIFTGKTEALQVIKTGFPNELRIKKIKHIGDIVFAPVHDVNGNVVRPGTIIAEQYKDDKENALKLKQNDFAAKKIAYERTMKVYEQTRRTSKKEVDTVTAAYYESKYNLEKAMYELAACEIVAPFTGIVTDIIKAEGNVGKGEVLELTRMDVMLIRIPFNSEIVNHIDKTSPVIVYPPGNYPGVTAWVERDNKDPRILNAYVPNSIISDPMPPELQKLKKVYAVLPVQSLPLFGDPKAASLEAEDLISIKHAAKMLDCIPVESIHKDDKGTYVFQAEDQVAFSDTKGIAKSFKVKKIYVEKGDIESYFSLGARGGLTFTTLKNSGGLKKNDLVLVYFDPEIQDGETVVRDSVHWRFYPGTELEVGIPGIAGTGLYVPYQAVIQQGVGDYFVYVVENGKARIASVEITGRESGEGYYKIDNTQSWDAPPYYSVYAKIKEGSEILVPDAKNLNLLYEGCPVSTSPYPANMNRIQNEIIDILHPVADINKEIGIPTK